MVLRRNTLHSEDKLYFKEIASKMEWSNIKLILNNINLSQHVQFLSTQQHAYVYSHFRDTSWFDTVCVGAIHWVLST